MGDHNRVLAQLVACLDCHKLALHSHLLPVLDIADTGKLESFAECLPFQLLLGTWIVGDK
jgi:hypothetical protein